MQGAIAARLRRRFPGASREDLQDAVASAMTDLLDYWVHAANSLSDDHDRNYRYAVWRGERMGTQLLGQSIAAASELDSLDAMQESEDACLSDDRHLAAEADDTLAYPEDTVVEDITRQQVLAMVTELPDEKADWLKAYLAGVTTRDEAVARGVSQPLIVQRRKRLLDKLRETARLEGVL